MFLPFLSPPFGHMTNRHHGIRRRSRAIFGIKGRGSRSSRAPDGRPEPCLPGREVVSRTL